MSQKCWKKTFLGRLGQCIRICWTLHTTTEDMLGKLCQTKLVRIVPWESDWYKVSQESSWLSKILDLDLPGQSLTPEPLYHSGFKRCSLAQFCIGHFTLFQFWMISCYMNNHLQIHWTFQCRLFLKIHLQKQMYSVYFKKRFPEELEWAKYMRCD